MKKMELIQHFPVWGSTSGMAFETALQIMDDHASPYPFNMEKFPPDLDLVRQRMERACADATKAKRVGMMRSSQFHVRQTATGVEVWHLLDSGERLWLEFQIKVI